MGTSAFRSSSVRDQGKVTRSEGLGIALDEKAMAVWENAVEGGGRREEAQDLAFHD